MGDAQTTPRHHVRYNRGLHHLHRSGQIRLHFGELEFTLPQLLQGVICVVCEFVHDLQLRLTWGQALNIREVLDEGLLSTHDTRGTLLLSNGLLGAHGG
jgi:hypothetical protein